METPRPSSASVDSGAPEACYGLEELLAVAGQRLGEEISPRTVRLYATEGLIDRPGKDGRRALYGNRQLLQLLLIRALARRGLSLTAIAPLVVCSDEELAQQLQQLLEPAAGDHNGSAAGQSTSTEQQEALVYLQNLQPERSGSRTTGSTASLLPLLGTPVGSSAAVNTTRRQFSTRTPGRTSGTGSRWHRFSLAPGVELHLNDTASIPPAGSRRQAWLARLLERLQEQLDALD